MSHAEVYELFEHYLPNFAEKVDEWFPNGKDSIRIRLVNNCEFIFSYTTKQDWRFETRDSFIKFMPYIEVVNEGGKSDERNI